jgi:drug/metabolite transporter (DMT)-like permease
MAQSAALSTNIPSVSQGRILIALAALLWSLSGAFTKLLTHEASFPVGPTPVPGIQIAFYRAFFAGLVLLPLLRPRHLTFRPMMLVMIVCFAAMNTLFVLAMAWGKAANAILLQYTAPMWMYLASIWWLGDKPERKNLVALVIGLAGIATIIWGGWKDAQLGVVAIALGSGLAYAGVILCLRILRDANAPWLTVVNHLFGALVLVPLLWYLAFNTPTPGQLIVLFFFGAVQMGLPYWLMARGLRSVGPQEAGTITLLEPLLNPVWAYLVAPRTEVPSVFTLAGGALILGALAWRYWPRKRSSGRNENGTRINAD